MCPRSCERGCGCSRRSPTNSERRRTNQKLKCANTRGARQHTHTLALPLPCALIASAVSWCTGPHRQPSLRLPARRRLIPPPAGAAVLFLEAGSAGHTRHRRLSSYTAATSPAAIPHPASVSTFKPPRSTGPRDVGARAYRQHHNTYNPTCENKKT